MTLAYPKVEILGTVPSKNFTPELLCHKAAEILPGFRDLV